MEKVKILHVLCHIVSMGQSAYIAKRAAVKSSPYAKSGTEKAIQAYRVKQAEKKITTQRIKAAASKSQGKGLLIVLPALQE